MLSHCHWTVKNSAVVIAFSLNEDNIRTKKINRDSKE